MNKKIIIATFCVISVALLLFIFFYRAPAPKFRMGHDLVDASYELGRLIALSDISIIGKVVESVDAGEPLYREENKIDSREFKKFKAKITVLMKIKGQIDEDIITFDYFSPKYQFGFHSLSVGDLILFAPKSDSNKYPVWFKKFIALSMDGRFFDNLWYENIDYKKGAEILKFLGYRVYDKRVAISLLEQFYGKSASDEFMTTILTEPNYWIIRGKCNRFFGWGCGENNFCYTISFFEGKLKKCPE